MNAPHLHFLGWHKPAIELVAEELLQLNATAPDAFRRATVIVPTAESGRKLREYIATRAGKPILMPKICQGSHLLSTTTDYTPIQEYAAWIHVLSTHTPEQEWPTLFPTAPLIKLNWCYGMAHQLMQLSNKLQEACLSPRQIAHNFYNSGNEKEAVRWNEIEDIFTKKQQQLTAWGFTPVISANNLTAHVDKVKGQLIIVACLPQMSERFRRFLDTAAQQLCDVHIFINAPEHHQGKSMRPLFHARYGTPLPAWQQEPICIPDSAIRVTPNGAEMTCAAVKACEHYDSNQIVLGCCDSSFAPRLRQGFTLAGWPLNMPEGRSFLTTDAGQLPAQLLRSISDPAKLHTTEPLLRNVALQRALGLTPDEQLDFNQWLDEIICTKLPTDTDYLLKRAQAEHSTRPHLANYLSNTRQLLLQLSDIKTHCSTLINLGLQIQTAYAPVAENIPTASFCNILLSLAEIQPLLPILQSPAAILSLLQSLTAQASTQELSLISTPRDKTALDATGWMELPYSHGSKLILCGLHDQCIPESPSVDAFLPESLCRNYAELPNMEQRRARDSFILTALLQAYPDNAHIIIAQTSDDGTPIAPSPLLLRFPEQQTEQLLNRVSTLFTPLPVPETPHQPGVHEMHTSIERIVELEHISQLRADLQSPWADFQKPFSPSGLAAFLNCPLRFWLATLLGLDPQNRYENTKTAMNDAEYGTMLHRVLELLVRQYTHDPHPDFELQENIFEKAKHIVQQEFAKEYGKNPSLPLQAQQQMLKNSVQAFCRYLWMDYDTGWEPVYLEHKTQPTGWKLDGNIPFRMTIDRIDKKRKIRSNEYNWRIIDYKTRDTSPETKHREKLKSEAVAHFNRLMPDFPLHCKQENQKKNGDKVDVFYRWKEVQLPLYAKWLMDTHRVKLEDIEVGYYVLPRNKKECKYIAWQLTQEDLDNALQWVRAAVKLIREGRCLLSAESLGWKTYANFGALTPDGDPRRMMGLPDIAMQNN